MKPGAVQSVVWAQVLFCVCLLVSIILKPAGLAANDGISYYGIYARTFIPFAIGLLGAAYCYFRAARSMANAVLKPALILSSLLTVVIVFTPYSLNGVTDWLHTAAGSVLFSLQLLLSFWLVATLRFDIRAILLAVIELLSGILCFVYLRPAHGFLIQCQILFQLSFGALVIYSISKLPLSTPYAKRTAIRRTKG